MSQPQDFIPFGQSTPRGSGDRGGGGGWRGNRSHHNRSQPRWSNNSRNNSSGYQNRQPYNNSDDISAYLHPNMLQDPWRHLCTPAQPPSVPHTPAK